MLRMVPEEDRERTHVFGTYFYHSMVSTRVLDSSYVGMTKEEQVHDRVKNWTKNVNIFEKDFIVIPILVE